MILKLIIMYRNVVHYFKWPSMSSFFHFFTDACVNGITVVQQHRSHWVNVSNNTKQISHQALLEVHCCIGHSLNQPWLINSQTAVNPTSLKHWLSTTSFTELHLRSYCTFFQELVSSKSQCQCFTGIKRYGSTSEVGIGRV